MHLLHGSLHHDCSFISVRKKKMDKQTIPKKKRRQKETRSFVFGLLHFATLRFIEAFVGSAVDFFFFLLSF